MKHTTRELGDLPPELLYAIMTHLPLDSLCRAVVASPLFYRAQTKAMAERVRFEPLGLERLCTERCDEGVRYFIERCGQSAPWSPAALVALGQWCDVELADRVWRLLHDDGDDGGMNEFFCGALLRGALANDRYEVAEHLAGELGTPVSQDTALVALHNGRLGIAEGYVDADGRLIGDALVSAAYYGYKRPISQFLSDNDPVDPEWWSAALLAALVAGRHGVVELLCDTIESLCEEARFFRSVLSLPGETMLSEWSAADASDEAESSDANASKRCAAMLLACAAGNHSAARRMGRAWPDLGQQLGGQRPDVHLSWFHLFDRIANADEYRDSRSCQVRVLVALCQARHKDGKGCGLLSALLVHDVTLAAVLDCSARTKKRGLHAAALVAYMSAGHRGRWDVFSWLNDTLAGNTPIVMGSHEDIALVAAARYGQTYFAARLLTSKRTETIPCKVRYNCLAEASLGGHLDIVRLLVMWQRANVAKVDCATCASSVAVCESALATASCQRSRCGWRLPRSAASSLDAASFWLSPEGGFDAWCRDCLFDSARMGGRYDIAALCLQAPIAPRITRKHIRPILRCIRHDFSTTPKKACNDQEASGAPSPDPPMSELAHLRDALDCTWLPFDQLVAVTLSDGSRVGRTRARQLAAASVLFDDVEIIRWLYLCGRELPEYEDLGWLDSVNRWYWIASRDGPATFMGSSYR